MTPALISTSSGARGAPAASPSAAVVAARAVAATRAAPFVDEDTTTTTTTTATTTTTSSSQHASMHLQQQKPPRGGDDSSMPHCSPRTKPRGHHLHSQDKQQLVGGPDQPAGGLASSARLRSANMPACKLLVVASSCEQHAAAAALAVQDDDCMGVVVGAATATVHMREEGRPQQAFAAAATHISSERQGGYSSDEEEGGLGEHQPREQQQQQQSQEGSERQQHEGDDSTMHCDEDEGEWSEDDGDATMAPPVPPAPRAPPRGQRWSDSEEQDEQQDDDDDEEEEEADDDEEEEDRGDHSDGMRASSEQLGADGDGDGDGAYGEEEEEEGEEALDSRCGGSGSGATTSGGAGGQDSLPGEEMLMPLAFCRNCTSTLRPERWCALCGHHADDDEGLFDARPAHVQQHELFATRGLLAPPPALTASAGLVHHSAAPQPPAAAASSSSCGGGGGVAGGKVALVYDERMEQHEEGASQPHPERPDRVRAVMARLLASGLASQCERLECREATIEELELVHTPELMEFVKAVAAGLPPPPSYPLGLLTPDTYVNPHTYQCARLAAGGAAQVARTVARGEALHGAAIIRPPGHHAESNVAMGFCFFNNAGVAARAAQAEGARRVLILDFDVHHGNGTQHMFEEDPSVMYMSLHRWDNGQFYPGTGAPDEVGVGAGAGYSVNVAWNGGGLRNADYTLAFDRVLMPVARAFRPDVVIASAGFDAADGDPIGGCRLTPECFGHMTAALKALGPLVLLLEGGYNLSATARSTEACLRVLLGQPPAPLPGPTVPTRAGAAGVLAALHVQRHFWPCLRQAYAETVQQLRALALQHEQQQQQQRAAAAEAVAAVQLEARKVVVVSAPVPPRPKAAPGGGGATAEAERRRRAAERRKVALLQQIRKRAKEAWWARHRRKVAARAAGRAAASAAAGLQE